MRFRRSKHSLSHFVNLTADMGELIPAGCVEVLPGDTVRHQSSVLVRMSPLLAPVMHPVDVRVHHFFVPNRILWTNWESFITGGSDGNDASVVPTVAHTATPANEPLLDYLGVPNVANLANISALPVRAYNKIYNEFYRDQDLVTEVLEDSMTVQKIAWAKDLFTAARPWTQKGTEVTLPLQGLAPIEGLGVTGSKTAGPGTVKETGSSPGTESYANYWNSSTNQIVVEEDGTATDYPAIYANLANATNASVNDLRLSFATQSYRELRAMYGSNYVDYLAYLGVNPQDQRLQRPEYLGGGKQSVSFSEVLATSPEASSSTSLGDFGGHGISALRSNRYQRFIPEHGWIITMLSVRPKSMYADGLHKKFSRDSKEDFYQRELELIGQQEVYNREVYASHTTPGGVFGYSDRYGEYRSEPSRVAGLFRPGSSLDHWSLARSFSSDPALNQTFIECVPTKRIHADTTGPTVWAMVNHSIAMRRLVRSNAKPRAF